MKSIIAQYRESERKLYESIPGDPPVTDVIIRLTGSRIDSISTQVSENVLKALREALASPDKARCAEGLLVSGVRVRIYQVIDF